MRRILTLCILMTSGSQLSYAQTKPTDAERLATANADKAEWEADAARSAAKKAKAEALTAGFNGSGISGEVKAGDNAGQAEAALLSTIAINDASARIASQIGPGRLLIVAGKDAPDLTAAQLYELRRSAVEKDLSTAKLTHFKAMMAYQKYRRPGLMAGPVAAVSAALTAASTIASFFKTDYAVGGVAVTSDDYMLAVALAGRMCGEAQISGQLLTSDPAAGIAQNLSKLEDSARTARQALADTQRDTALLKKAKPSAAQKAAHAQLLAAFAAASSDLETALARYDAFMVAIGLGAKKADGDAKATGDSISLEAVVAQERLRSALAEAGRAVFVRVHSTSGAFYTEKNLWSGLGVAMPFHVSGSANISWSLIDAASGKVTKGGLLPVPTRYASAKKVAAYVTARSNEMAIEDAKFCTPAAPVAQPAQDSTPDQSDETPDPKIDILMIEDVTAPEAM